MDKASERNAAGTTSARRAPLGVSSARLTQRPSAMHRVAEWRGLLSSAASPSFSPSLDWARLRSVLAAGRTAVRGAKAVDAYFDERDAYYAACEGGDGVGGTNEIVVDGDGCAGNYAGDDCIDDDDDDAECNDDDDAGGLDESLSAAYAAPAGGDMWA